MKDMFLNVLEAGFQGSVMIALVLVLRLVLKNAPRRTICLLWLLAGLRLLLPFQIESGLSLQPDSRYLFQPRAESEFFQSQPAPAIPDAGALPDDVEIVTGDAVTGVGNAVEYPVQQPVVRDWTAIAAWGWLAGACAMGLYSAGAYLALRRRVREAVKLADNSYHCPGLETAFVLGFFRPRIYLPAENPYVLAHERAHIRRGDHWFKLLGFAALALHWFNPLVWVGYLLLCRDLEMACDEAVVRDMDLSQRKAYSAALLACAARRSTIAACPVAFGEVSVKRRIVSVLNYRKPRFWICILAAVAVLFVAVCFLTSPGGMADEEVLDAFYQEMDEIQSSPKIHLFHTEERDCEVDATAELVYSDCWIDGDLRYQTFYYNTDGGHFTNCFAIVDGVYCTRQYSDDIADFIDSKWQEVPYYYDPGRPLTGNFRSLEVMEVKKDRTHGGAYSIRLACNLSNVQATDTIFEKYYDIHLDGDGHLLCLHQFTHGEFYMSEGVAPGVYESRIYTTLTVEPWDEEWKEELADLEPYKERLFQERTMEKCRLALTALQNSSGCYITEDAVTENTLTGTATSHMELWLADGSWLWIREKSNADGTEKWYQMMADGVQYQRFEGDRYYDGGPFSTQWEVHDAPNEKPWLVQFDFDAVKTVFLNYNVALGAQEMVTFNVITGEEDGFSTGYTLTFYLDDGILESAVRTMDHTYPDGPLEAQRSTVTTTVVSADTPEAAAAIDQQIRLMREQRTQ